MRLRVRPPVHLPPQTYISHIGETQSGLGTQLHPVTGALSPRVLLVCPFVTAGFK